MFTDKAIAALKPKSKRYEAWEGGGFGMRVTPRGVKSWVLLYRFQGRPRRMTLGTYPTMGLADARLNLAKARKVLEKGEDPGTKLVEDRKAERAAETVAELVDEYLERWAKPRKRSASEDERILRKEVVPKWGHRKAWDVTRRDVIALLDPIVERGAPIAANRTLATIRKMFNWAVERDIVPTSPCAQVKAPAKENQRDRVLTAVEIATLWHGLDDAKMSPGIRPAIRPNFKARSTRLGEKAHAVQTCVSSLSGMPLRGDSRFSSGTASQTLVAAGLRPFPSVTFDGLVTA